MAPTPATGLVHVAAPGAGRRALATAALAIGIALAAAGVLAILANPPGDVRYRTVHVGDEDKDGKVDEDPPGDADASADDPRRADGLAELREPRDDDGDGRVDEDPPPMTLAERMPRAIPVGPAGAGAAFVGGTALALAGLAGRRGPRPG